MSWNIPRPALDWEPCPGSRWLASTACHPGSRWAPLCPAGRRSCIPVPLVGLSCCADGCLAPKCSRPLTLCLPSTYSDQGQAADQRPARRPPRLPPLHLPRRLEALPGGAHPAEVRHSSSAFVPCLLPSFVCLFALWLGPDAAASLVWSRVRACWAAVRAVGKCWTCWLKALAHHFLAGRR
jgi:hypothetical protein